MSVTPGSRTGPLKVRRVGAAGGRSIPSIGTVSARPRTDAPNRTIALPTIRHGRDLRIEVNAPPLTDRTRGSAAYTRAATRRTRHEPYSRVSQGSSCCSPRPSARDGRGPDCRQPGCGAGYPARCGAMLAQSACRAGWNGQLVVYAPGYRAPQLPKDFYQLTTPDGVRCRCSCQSLGYAFATTSYRQDRPGHRRRRRRRAPAGRQVRGERDADAVHVTGVSEGGLVATLLAERSP